MARFAGRLPARPRRRGLQGRAESTDLSWLPPNHSEDAAKPAAAPEAVDSVLSALDLGDESVPTVTPAQTPMGSLVSALAGGGSIPPKRPGHRRALAELEQADQCVAHGRCCTLHRFRSVETLGGLSLNPTHTRMTSETYTLINSTPTKSEQ